jgi:uncharacterized membrane-anchored protein
MKMNNAQIEALASEISNELHLKLDVELKALKDEFYENNEDVERLDNFQNNILQHIRNELESNVENIQQEYNYINLQRHLNILIKQAYPSYPENIKKLLKKKNNITISDVKRKIILSTIGSDLTLETLKAKIAQQFLNETT